MNELIGDQQSFLKILESKIANIKIEIDSIFSEVRLQFKKFLSLETQTSSQKSIYLNSSCKSILKDQSDQIKNKNQILNSSTLPEYKLVDNDLKKLNGQPEKSQIDVLFKTQISINSKIELSIDSLKKIDNQDFEPSNLKYVYKLYSVKDKYQFKLKQHNKQLQKNITKQSSNLQTNLFFKQYLQKIFT